MRALYSLVCHVRTVCALVQAMAALALDGWAALAPAQLWVLGCGLGIVLRVLVPSPPPGKAGWSVVADRLVSGTAAVSVVALTAESLVDGGLSLGRLALGV